VKIRLSATWVHAQLVHLVRALRAGGHFTAVAVTRPFAFEGGRKAEAAGRLVAALQDAAHLVAVIDQARPHAAITSGCWSDALTSSLGEAVLQVAVRLKESAPCMGLMRMHSLFAVRVWRWGYQAPRTQRRWAVCALHHVRCPANPHRGGAQKAGAVARDPAPGRRWREAANCCVFDLKMLHTCSPVTFVSLALRCACQIC